MFTEFVYQGLVFRIEFGDLQLMPNGNVAIYYYVSRGTYRLKSVYTRKKPNNYVELLRMAMKCEMSAVLLSWCRRAILQRCSQIMRLEEEESGVNYNSLSSGVE